MSWAGWIVIGYLAVCCVLAALSVPDLLQVRPAPPRKKAKQ